MKHLATTCQPWVQSLALVLEETISYFALYMSKIFRFGKYSDFDYTTLFMAVFLKNPFKWGRHLKINVSSTDIKVFLRKVVGKR